MEIQQLRHLVAAVRCGNLLKAADECNISQSGLSRSIRSLEDRLGVPLLNRLSKGVEPTIFGQSIVRRAELILNEVGRSIDELRAIQAAEIGNVTFGITQNYGQYFIPGILAELYVAHPGIRVTVATGGFLDLVEQLNVGAIEFGFGLLGSVQENSEIILEPLREHHSRVVARASHPLVAKTQEVTPEELSAASWATLSGDFFQRSFVSYFTSRALNPPNQAVKTDSIALIHKFISSADVLTVLPPDIVRDALEAGSFAILNCDAPAERTHVGLIFRRHSLITPQSRQIVDRIRHRLSL